MADFIPKNLVNLRAKYIIEIYIEIQRKSFPNNNVHLSKMGKIG